MKRLLALLLVLVLVAGLAGCGIVIPKIPGATVVTDSDTPDTKDEVPTDSKAPEPDTTAAAPDTEAPEPDTEAPAPDTQGQEPAPDASGFEELVAIDNDDCTVKITGLEKNTFWGISLKTMLENKTADKNLRFYIERASVNGVSYDPYFSADVAPGKKANESLSFSDDDLNDLLGNFTDIELTIRVYDADDWSADDIVKETFHVYPYGEANASTFTREPQPTDKVLVDNENFTFVVTGYDPDDFWGYAMEVYLVNKTDVPLRFSADDVAVNGFMCDPYWAKTVSPGKVAITSMTWYESSFEENGITDVEKIEFSLRVYNADDFWADDFYHDTLKVTP